jgi:hypothetical protein
MSIPARATRKMKEDDARREKANADASLPARTGFDRADVSAKPEKGSTADATRLQPPSREPTKAKGTSDPNRDNVRTNRGYGNTGRTSEPRSSGGIDRVSRPVDKGSSGVAAPGSTVNPPVLTGGSDEKKKPPQNQ